ncbi:hypothetical protein [Rhizobium etli]|nr:hypothetical protein [Rhizobium sp. IE4771]
MGWVELQAERLEKEPGGCDLANAAVELRGTILRMRMQEFKNSQRDQLAILCDAAGSTKPQLLAESLFCY